MKIIGIIATKNRFEYFERALKSAVTQKRRLDELIVVSDSEADMKEMERQLTESASAYFLDDEREHNYAGSLNTAIHFILTKELFGLTDSEQTYVAFLDDDDVWEDEYILACEKALIDEDFVVSGIVYCNEQGEQPLSIPHELSVESFLQGNPHLQGSNTFVKLSTLLKAGLFDENMSSTTDRDIFTRIMLLNPTYAVVNRHLVKVDAFNSRERITNGRAKKAEGLRKFFYKYGGYMSEPVKSAFFARAKNLFGIDKENICNVPQRLKKTGIRYTKDRYRGNLTIGFIVTEYDLGLRLLKELSALKRENTKIVIFINFTQSQKPYVEILKDSGYLYELIDGERVLQEIGKGGFDQFVTEDKITEPVIKDIAVTRTILQKYLYRSTVEGDVIWILDEDMRLEELIYDGEKIKKCTLDIDAVIGEYIGEYDAVIGNYALDAPLPMLSTLRTSLLDYTYAQVGLCGECTLDSFWDYYYDLSDETAKHLETPVKCAANYILDDVFSGKARSRPLVIQDYVVREATSRGGNTIVFNRELLNIPNWSIQVGDKIGRRSDYFWVLLAKQKGYKIANVPFATLHDRSAAEFDFEKEKEKFLLDLIGSSFTKAIGEVGTNARKEEFCCSYTKFFLSRLTKFVASFYRIQGLLSIIRDKKYSAYFTKNALLSYLKEIQPYLESEKIKCAYDDICRKLHMQRHMQDKDVFQKNLEDYFHLPKNSLRLLGNGGEGVVFTDEVHVYKYFFKPLKNISFLKRISKKFSDCKQLYPLEFFEISDTTVIRYCYEPSTLYRGGYASDFSELLRFAKQNGFIFDNYKQNNFVVINGIVKLIDYGKSFFPFSPEGMEKSITRVYEMLRYPFLSENEFKQLIQRSYIGLTQYIDDGKEQLRKLVDRRFKEDLHDQKVLDLVRQANPSTVLDYGAGKCKIANRLAENYDVSVYDIDVDTISARANSNVKILLHRNELRNEQYDLITCNLVLCCVSNDIAQEIISDINAALKNSGKAIISICNPLFNTVQHTELRKRGLKGEYRRSEYFEKLTTVGTPVRGEYHRPIEYYHNLFLRNGFQIEQVTEGDGVDADTLMPISEHLIFVCRKVMRVKQYKDCTLLIKTNPMEWRSIYKNVCHIVNSLEKFGRFEHRVAIADLSGIAERARRYDSDDEEKLKEALLLARKNGLIDEILFAEDNDIEKENIYCKYFGVKSKAGHSSNGQGLYATLCAFEKISTKYVLQTDSDILYYINADVVQKGIDALKVGAVTVSLGIARSVSKGIVYGARVEVRTCLLALDKLKTRLPLPNQIIQGQVQLPWHRSLDLVLGEKESVRFADRDAWFIHPENQSKEQKNFLATVTERIETGWFCSGQDEQVNLKGARGEWGQKTNADVVVYIRGYNTPCEKLKRLFDSLKRQTFQRFDIVYIDDASTNESADYARLLLRYDLYFAGRTVTCWNDANVGELDNFVFAMQNMVINRNAIVINVDNDDYFVNDRAIEIIVKKFFEGAEITCGNCVRWDKPLKRYHVYSFDKVWERDGDNIWLHPKCFRRYLFDCIDIDHDLKIDGKYVDVNTDFAFMLPMIQKAGRKEFIEEILYYFEPSLENNMRTGKYSKQYKAEVKKRLLEKAKERTHGKR